MKRMVRICGLLLLCVAICPPNLGAQPPGGPGGQPAMVVVERVRAGLMQAQEEFVGTVNFQETSLVAAEVSGRVDEVHFEQGDLVQRGNRLMTMDGVLKRKDLLSRQAQREEVLTELARFQKDLERMQRLYDQKTVSEQEFDEVRFRVSGLERRAEYLNAEIAKIREELRKLIITAPFDGVVLERHGNPGEWLAPGSPVAELARIDLMDVLVNVPVGVARALKVGDEVRGRVAGQEVNGQVVAIVPRGDVSTRTFPLKMRLQNDLGLMEGMEVRLFLPVGQSHQGLIVPRDAVVPSPAGQVVFLAQEGQAKMIPVQVAAYSSDSAGIVAQGLQEGAMVVVKGQERLRDGQPVQVAGDAGQDSESGRSAE